MRSKNKRSETTDTQALHSLSKNERGGQTLQTTLLEPAVLLRGRRDGGEKEVVGGKEDLISIFHS